MENKEGLKVDGSLRGHEKIWETLLRLVLFGQPRASYKGFQMNMFSVDGDSSVSACSSASGVGSRASASGASGLSGSIFLQLSLVGSSCSSLEVSLLLSLMLLVDLVHLLGGGIYRGTLID